MQWQIGDVKVTLVREMHTGVELEGMFPGADRAVLDANVDWLKPHFLNDDGTLPLSIHALVLESQGKADGFAYAVKGVIASLSEYAKLTTTPPKPKAAAATK